MGIIMIWLMLRAGNLMEQIRRNQLTAAQRAAEDAAEIAWLNGILMILGAVLIVLLILIFGKDITDALHLTA
jgi:hypothetical protein